MKMKNAKELYNIVEQEMAMSIPTSQENKFELHKDGVKSLEMFISTIETCILREFVRFGLVESTRLCKRL